MEICYRSKGIDNYMETILGDKHKLDEAGNGFRIRMLLENDIPGIIKPVIMESDGIIGLRYNMSSLYIVDRFFESAKPDGAFVETFMRQMVESINKLEEHLISSDDIVLKADYMLYEPYERQVYFLCVPGYAVGIKKQLKAFLEYLMRIFDYRDGNGISLLYSLYETASDLSVGINDVIKFVQGYNTDKYENVSAGANATACNYNINTDSGTSQTAVTEEIREDDRKKWGGLIWSMSVAGVLMLTFLFRYLYFGRAERDLFFLICMAVFMVAVVVVRLMFGGGEDNHTEKDVTAYADCSGYYTEDNRENITYTEGAISNSPITYPDEGVNCLVPLTNGTLNNIDLADAHKLNSGIMVGRDLAEVDYALEQKQISRHHANIYGDGSGTCYLEDNNSTNGTYINARRLPANRRYKLQKGDIVKFANEEFFVK